MKLGFRRALFAWIPLAALLSGPLQAQTFSLDPRASFLRLGQGSSPFGSGIDAPVFDPVPFNLAGLGIHPGDLLRLDELGAFRFNTFVGTDTDFNTMAVFSSSNTIISGAFGSPGANAYNTVNRIP